MTRMKDNTNKDSTIEGSMTDHMEAYVIIKVVLVP
jgi:hypothetical protein